MLGKKIFFLGFSTVMSTLILAGAYEAYKDYSYEKGREALQNNGDMWYGGMAIPSKNPALMWEYRPNSEYKDLKIQTNRFGFRQRQETSPRKPEEITRVAFIGDSVTLGWGVDFKETFVSRFGAYSKEMFHKTNLEALNFGIDGYNASQIRELLTARVLSYSPGKIIYPLCLNDFDYVDSSASKIRYFKKPDSFVLELLGKISKHLFWAGRDFHEYHFTQSKKLVFRKIWEMQDILKKRDIEFYVAIVPVFKSVILRFPMGWDEHFPNSFQDYPLGAIHQEIIKTLGAKGIFTIDLLDGFQAQAKPPKFFAFDLWHPNPAGHRLIGLYLAKRIFGDGTQ